MHESFNASNIFTLKDHSVYALWNDQLQEMSDLFFQKINGIVFIHFSHYLLLVNGIFLLQKEEVSYSEIDLAEEHLHLFWGRMDLLYGSYHIFNIFVIYKPIHFEW